MTAGTDISYQQSKPKTNKVQKPQPSYFWGVAEVQKWLRRHCSDYHHLYSNNFLIHEIDGKALMFLNEDNLLRLGIVDNEHRSDIWRQVLKLRLKAEILDMKEIQIRNRLNFP